MSNPRRARRNLAVVMPAVHTSTSLKKLRQANLKEESNDMFDQIDADHSKSIGINEFILLIKEGEWPKIHEMFQRLNRILKQDEDKTANILAKVAMELATGKHGQEAIDAEITKEQFHQFRKKYILDEMGAEEVHERAVFENFDPDGNGELDKDELEAFLGAMYHQESQGRLHRSRRISFSIPQMRELILENYDVDGDQTISFNELRSIISGGMTALEALHTMKLEREKEKEKEKEKEGSGDEDEDSDEEEESSEEEEESIEVATRNRALRLLSMLETPEEKEQKRLERSQYLSNGSSLGGMDGSGSSLGVLEESDEEDEQDEEDEADGDLSEILEVSDEEESSEDGKISEENEVKDAAEENVVDAGMHETSDNSEENQEEKEVEEKITEVVAKITEFNAVSDESEKPKISTSGEADDAAEEIVADAGKQQSKDEAPMENRPDEEEVAKATEPAKDEEKDPEPIGRPEPLSGSDNAQAEGELQEVVVQDVAMPQIAGATAATATTTTDATGAAQHEQHPENTPETTPETEDGQPSSSTVRDPETETPAEVTQATQQNAFLYDPTEGGTASAPPPAVTNNVEDQNSGTPNALVGTHSTGFVRPRGGIVSDSLDESYEDGFDFCLWLDNLIWGKPEGERNTLCMRMSRHGNSSRRLKQESVH